MKTITIQITDEEYKNVILRRLYAYDVLNITRRSSDDEIHNARQTLMGTDLVGVKKVLNHGEFLEISNNPWC